MRWTRPLLLIAILAILGSVGATYYARLKDQNRDAPAKPAALRDGISSSSQGWSYTQTVNSKPVVWVHADDFEESGGKFHLTGVELHIFHKDGSVFDKVKSAKADFNINEGMLFSDGEVEITMGVKADDQPAGRLMHIKSSGVTFESKTGKATTDRPATFEFDMGNGQATGATYDPQIHELHMRSHVQLLWRGHDAKAKPMHVEAAELTYKEKESKVFLGGPSKLTRDTLTLNAGPAVVNLVKGIIDSVETEKAQGSDHRPGRNIEYVADKLTMNMDEHGQIRKILGDQNGRLVSETENGQTTITTDRIDLAFTTEDQESILDTAVATGHSIAESKPAVKKGVDPADTRILRSDVIRTKMRAGGQEIDNVETDGAGALEFIPNRPGQPHRWMNGDRLWIKYGDKNQIESFRSINVATKTEKPRPKDAKENPPLSLTWSKNLKADFDPKTSQLAKLEQWTGFRYEEGTRKAQADRALLDQAQNLIHLTGAARVWDTTGSTDGDVILLDQKSGDFTAEGNVSSTQIPDKKKPSPASAATNSGGGLLAADQPLHARARKMSSTDNGLQVRYEGNAVVWQSANRLQADVIEIDRDQEIVKAHGKVVSQLLDKADPPPKDSKKPPPSPVFTIVKAPEMVYNDEQKLAWYKGGVLLNRPGMQVKSRELRAFLRDSEDDSSLDHAFADGKVEVVQTAPGRTRTGTSEHAEYYVDEARVILETGRPQLLDSLKGSTKGKKLTWFSNDDRLLVDGAEGQPAQSNLRRK